MAARRSRRSPLITPFTRSRGASGKSSCWMVTVSSSSGGRRTRARRRARLRKLSCSSSTASQKTDGYGKLQMELEWLKIKISAALIAVNCETWPITTTLSSASAATVYCWVYQDRRMTTGPHRCRNRRCGSWPGSMLSTWKIPAAAAAGWSSTWPEKESRSAATGCET